MSNIFEARIRRTNQLAELIKNQEQVTPDILGIKDANGEILVHLKKGYVARRYTNGKIRQYATGELSNKNNGYVYLSVFYKTEAGKLKSYTVGQHTLICMLSDPEGYKPGLVPCHKNACKWDNEASNLEWGTQQDNVRHDKIVHRLAKTSPDKVVSRHNLSKKEFTCLKEPLTIAQVNEIYSK